MQYLPCPLHASAWLLAAPKWHVQASHQPAVTPDCTNLGSDFKMINSALPVLPQDPDWLCGFFQGFGTRRWHTAHTCNVVWTCCTCNKLYTSFTLTKVNAFCTCVTWITFCRLYLIDSNTICTCITEWQSGLCTRAMCYPDLRALTKLFYFI